MQIPEIEDLRTLMTHNKYFVSNLKKLLVESISEK